MVRAGEQPGVAVCLADAAGGSVGNGGDEHCFRAVIGPTQGKGVIVRRAAPFDPKIADDGRIEVI